jgi:hypothetical protein
MIGVERRTVVVTMVIGLLTSCGQQPAPVPPKTAKSDVDEMRADVEAVKNSPSLTNPSKFAGAPIDVKLYHNSSEARHVNGEAHAGMNIN